jgi:hypothetical protein
MDKQILTIASIFILIVLTPLASAAISIEIDVKNSFSLNENISFNYSITSTQNETITFIPFVSCLNAPGAMLSQEEIQLEANVPFEGVYDYIEVTENIEPQTCKASIRIISPEEQEKSENFTIETKPSFDFSLKICKDAECAQEAKVFILNEDVYLDYESEIEPEISAILILPDKTTQSLALPASIKAEQMGNYNLEITASKEGYKTATIKDQFGIIEKQAEIPIVSCNLNRKCEEEIGENIESCPQDCKKKFPILVIVIAIVIAVIALAIILLKLLPKIKIKRENKKDQDIEKIKRYIQEMRNKEFSNEQIKSELLKIGWPADTVNKAFE